MNCKVNDQIWSWQCLVLEICTAHAPYMMPEWKGEMEAMNTAIVLWQCRVTKKHQIKMRITIQNNLNRLPIQQLYADLNVKTYEICTASKHCQLIRMLAAEHCHPGVPVSCQTASCNAPGDFEHKAVLAAILLMP